MSESQKHKPTNETRTQVKSFAMVGVPHDMIGRLIGIDAKTLRKYYAEELETGEAHGVAAVAKTLFARATKGNDLSAVIFYLKARAGWSEKQRVEVTGADGGPVEISALESARAKLARRFASIKGAQAKE